MYSKINKLEQQIDRVEQKIDRVEQKIDILLERSLRSENHIDFIENTYDTFKNPLFFVKDKINNLIGKQPVLSDKKYTSK